MEHHTSENGFSLLELLVASAIFFAFMVGMTSLYSKSHRSFTRGQNRIQVQQSARIAARSMGMSIRVAGYDPSLSADYLGVVSPIRLAESERLTIIADVDGDRVSDQVTYRRVGDRLVRDLAAWEGTGFGTPETSELAEGISSLSFSYFDGSSPVNTFLEAPVTGSDLSLIQRISVEVVATSSGVNGEERYPLTLDVKLRNVPPGDSDDEGAD